MKRWWNTAYPGSARRREAETDEPLAIFALVDFVEREKLTLEQYLTRALNTSNAAHRGIVFEAFSAYFLVCSFSEPRPLSKICEFIGDKKAYNALQDKLAGLVTLTKGDDI